MTKRCRLSAGDSKLPEHRCRCGRKYRRLRWLNESVKQEHGETLCDTCLRDIAAAQGQNLD